MTRRTCIAACLAAAMLGPAAGAQQLVHALAGNFDEDRFGTSVAIVGDLDGDGGADLAVGALRDDDGGLDSGTVRLVSGATGAELFTVAGAPQEMLGSAVAGPGDVDGDGIPDVLAGAPEYFFETGFARLFSGADGATILTIHALNGGDRMGDAVAAAGDVNLDGVLDLLVGSPRETAGIFTNAGRARVYSGANGSVLRTFSGLASTSRFGSSLASMGNLIGDGYPALAIGAPLESDKGAVHVASGQNGAFLLHYYGSAGFDRFGASIAVPGDTSGDGIVDLLIGIPGSDLGGTDAGAAVVIRGLFSTVQHQWLGAAQGDALGSAVAGVGDQDGDGRPDVFLGSPQSDAAGTDSGAGVVRSGATGAVLATLQGAHPGDAFGKSCAGGSDVDRDGIADCAIGAPDADPNGNLSGAAYVYSRPCGSVAAVGTGCPTGSASVPSLALDGCFVPTGIASLELAAGVPNGTALLFIGFASPPLALPGGCLLHLSPLPAPIALPLDAAGGVAFSATLPPGSPFVSFAVQSLMIDPSAPHGFASTNAVDVTVP